MNSPGVFLIRGRARPLLTGKRSARPQDETPEVHEIPAGARVLSSRHVKSAQFLWGCNVQEETLRALLQYRRDARRSRSTGAGRRSERSH